MKHVTREEFQLDGVDNFFNVVIVRNNGKVTNVDTQGSLSQDCGYCGDPDCRWSCDESAGSDDFEEDERVRLGEKLDAIQNLIVVLAKQGVDISNPEIKAEILAVAKACG